MAVAVMPGEEVLAGARRSLGIKTAGAALVDNEFLAAALRHTAGILCPCSGAALRSALVESLQHLATPEGLSSRIEDAIEGLVVGGDLLELNQVTTGDTDAKGTWLFAAPPGYIVRPNGSIFLTGIVADRDTYLPQELMERIKHDDFTRAIMPVQGEELAEQLSELGLQTLNSDNWLKPPKAENAADLLQRHVSNLDALTRSGDIPQLQIIDPATPVTYYRGRWVQPKRQTGVFVGRRPQEFGFPIWCLVRLQDGQAQQLLDLPLHKSKLRGCDIAWQIQMAMDRENHTPQEYRIRRSDEHAFLDFFSPIPLWAARRLMLLGRHADAAGCLLSYRLPLKELDTEEKFIQERLWLGRSQATESGVR
ncbi:MAG: hypothetical protein M3N97_03765 [Pseudomonadota bacterium]|nr:hypothetical protein [Pseudomonadota bacterium]